jgi:pimeloyl-ACP methyl ester carboxylesterase
MYKKHLALLVDLPGHGRSEKPDVAYTPERFARATTLLLSAPCSWATAWAAQ